MDPFTANYPPLSAKFKGSFAYRTVKDRMPVILTQVVDYLYREKKTILNIYGEDAQEELKAITGKLSQLRSEMQTNKPISPVDASIEGADLWNYCHSQMSQPVKWFDSPWLFVECYMYWSIYESFQQSVHFKLLDPFLHKKEETFQRSLLSVNKVIDYLVESFETVGRSDSLEVFFNNLMQMSVWANRNDLSLSAGSVDSECRDLVANLDLFTPNLLINDSPLVWTYIKNLQDKGEFGQLSIIMDNIGLELICDLCLADSFIHYGLFSKVCFYVKKLPWFVSDVSSRDFHWTLQQLKNDRPDLVGKWLDYLRSGKWQVIEETYWTSPVPYHLMESLDNRLYQQLSSGKLLIFKGDLNYRKLGADLQWPSDTSFESFLRNFRPSPLVVMRTLKSEIICGNLETDKLSSQCDNWLVSGEYAVMQFAN